ncbi:hypothetical protein Tcan_05845 [Toxocara canis]|uniref:Uncharacterized protein n=1 Tax=Toxocara canis TaxID=6265 RepID=A0A0B2VUQ3_TOXCA|nr:hypothetical protein Tcan_05845 [Toxocara canis]
MLTASEHRAVSSCSTISPVLLRNVFQSRSFRTSKIGRTIAEHIEYLASIPFRSSNDIDATLYSRHKLVCVH